MLQLLEQRILDELRRKPWQKAADLARSIGVDRSDVNSTLYGKLNGRVIQDRQYRWALADAKTGKSDDNKPPPDTPFARLCRYYLDCLQRGEQGGVSVYASSYNDLDYAELRSFFGGDVQLGNPFTDAEPSRIVRPCLGHRATRVLRIGYPVYVAQLTSRKGFRFATVEPLLIWTPAAGDVERHGMDAIAREIPSLNPSAIQHLSAVGGIEALDALVHLSRDLGLDHPNDEPPELDELLQRLRAIRPEWPWKEAPDARQLGTSPALNEVQDAGIFNRAVVVATERSPYTKGLETELSNLARQAEALESRSALADWVANRAATPQTRSKAGSSDSKEPLLEVVPLNSEQREAVESALTRALTVITGPPGTGKSQVVSAILVNAAWRGKRVLFASKNHKAVDVVEERVNRLGPRPFVLRLGSGELNAALRQHLSGLLSATATPEDQRAFAEAKSLLESVRGAIAKLDDEAATIVRRRNEVDSLEQQLEAARAILAVDRFAAAKSMELSPFRSAASELRTALDTLDVSNAGFFARLFWRFAFPRRLDRARSLLQATREPALQLGVEIPHGDPGERDLSAWRATAMSFEERIELASATKEYFDALTELSNRRALETVLRDRVEWMRQIASESQRLWNAWLRVQPTRMAQDSRRELSEFAAVLEMVSRSDEESGRISSEVWSKYYRLTQSVVRILPCWSITSLSAKGRLPLEVGSFDLVVIDEASQCDIASALPLLYRAKAAVIIGDPQQLKHITPLNQADDSRLLAQYGLVEHNLAWAYSTRSLFDLAQSLCAADSMVQLRDHHRSHPDIISFSNECFYEGRLRVATKLDRLRRPESSGPAVRWVEVSGNVERPGNTSLLNDKEARSVVAELDRLVVRQGYRGTVGVVSPFRAQINRIRDLVAQHPQLSALQDRVEFLADSVHSFQGDERDVILFSPTISQGRQDRAVGFLGGSPNLFNVAITRARAALIVVGDRSAARNCGIEYFRRFVEYVSKIEHPAPSLPKSEDLGPDYPRAVDRGQVSEWERVFYRALYGAGARPIPQYVEEKYLLDFALLDGDRKLDVEVDGERYHRAWDGDLLRSDQLRNMRLIELGWDVIRFWVYQIRDDLDRSVDRVKEWLDRR